MKEAVRTWVCVSKDLKNPAHFRRRQDQWKRPRLSQEPECSPTHAHNHFPFSILTPLSPLPFMLSCPLPIPPANKAKWVLWCGGRKGAKGKKNSDGEGRRAGANQTGTEIRNSKHSLERHHWCKDDIYWRVTHAVNYTHVLLRCTKDRMPPLWLLLLLLWSW